MTSRIITCSKSILLLIGFCMIAALVGCSSSSNGGGTTTPSVSLSTAPTSLSTGGTLSITATVTNDSGNGGVTWSCTPGNSAATCGSFSASKSASGAAVTYTAPNAAASVVITATVVDDASVTASTPAIAVSSAPAITVTLSTPPPLALAPGGTATIAATVANDSANKGVTWSCSPAATCGSFNPTSTASAATTVFTAGTTVGTIVVKATSVSATTISASANVNITTAASGPLAAGNYTFWLAGTDSTGSPYYVAGAFTIVPGAGSSGTISNGEQDFVDYYYVLPQDGIAGSYSVTADGNLQIILNTGDTCIGPGATSSCGQSGGTGNGQEILNATLTSTPTSATSSARIIEFDSWATGSGQLEPQTAVTATPLSGYAFSVSGLDGNNLPNALGIGGVVNVDTSGNISGSGSVFDENDGGVLSPAQGFTASTVDATPDQFGRVTFTLNSSALGSPGIVLVAYFVNSAHLRLVEGSDSLMGTTGGQAFVQTGTGTFGTASFQGSSYVFQAAGADNSADGFLQAAGVLTGNTDGSTANGTVSTNNLTTNITPDGGTALASGTYAVDSTGRVTLSNLVVGGFTYNLQLYLDGNGNARLLSMDANDEIDGLANLQSGSLNASVFSGTYAMGSIGEDQGLTGPFDAVGPEVATGTGGTFSGFADLNWIVGSGPVPDLNPVSGTYTAPSGGICTGTISGLDLTTSTNQDAFTYYLINSGTVVGIESDANQLTLIRFELQQ